MKALVYRGPGRRSWQEVPEPGIQAPTDAVVRVDAVTICGTDLHILKGDVPAVEPAGDGPVGGGHGERLGIGGRSRGRGRDGGRGGEGSGKGAVERGGVRGWRGERHRGDRGDTGGHRG